MKKYLVSALAACMLILAVLQPARVSAEEMWTEDYYRAVDASNGLSDAEREDLDSLCLEFIRKWHLDLAMVSMPSDTYEETMEDIARSYYEDCGFGYGENADGFMMIWYTDTGEMKIVPVGAAENAVPADYLSFIEETAPPYLAANGTYGPFYATCKLLDSYLEEHGTDDGTDEGTDDGTGGSADPNARVGEGSDLPAWYPVDTEHFEFYHDETAPRVVDEADIFTDEEEAAMEARLAEIRTEIEKDIVIYTDMTDYGLGHMECADDFYDYNGYGIGDEYEGMCLYVCMDPGNRGFWTSGFGPETKSMYTETVADQIDDMLYAFMKEGEYGEGVSDWIENVRRSYRTLSPYTPDWADLIGSEFERFHDENAPRVLDEARILTEEEENALAEKAARIAEKYGTDVVIHTARNEGNIDREEYPDFFYLFNGYGSGENYDGIELTIFKRPYYTGTAEVTAYGAAEEKLTETNQKRLVSRFGTISISSEETYAKADAWLDQTEHMLKTGRAPRSAGSWGFFTALELTAGLIFGGISLSRAKAKMPQVKKKKNADPYVVQNSLRVAKVSDTFLNRTVSRVYSPPPKEDDSSSRSSGSSSSGRSSYSSSHTSSSGRSHTGSGRRF